MGSGGRTVRGLTRATATAMLCAVALTGCAMSAPKPSLAGSVGPEAPHAPSESLAPLGSKPIAMVTIAAVDVDGKTATVAGFVTQISESGGSCRFALTPLLRGSARFVASPSTPNIETTSCGAVQVPTATLAKGTWSIVLHYSSNTWDLASQPVTMEVP